MTELNPFSYKAMEIKISKLKPKALRELASSLVTEVDSSLQYQREEKLNHYIYCLKAFVLIQKRLRDISKLQIKHDDISSYEYSIKLIVKTINKYPERLYIVDLSDILFRDSTYFSYPVDNFKDLKVLNKIYSEFKDKSLKPSTSINVSALAYLDGTTKGQIIKQWCVNNLEPEEPIFKLFNKSKIREIDENKIEDFEQTAIIVKQLKKKYDEEQSATN